MLCHIENSLPAVVERRPRIEPDPAGVTVTGSTGSVQETEPCGDGLEASAQGQRCRREYDSALIEQRLAQQLCDVQRRDAQHNSTPILRRRPDHVVVRVLEQSLGGIKHCLDRDAGLASHDLDVGVRLGARLGGGVRSGHHAESGPRRVAD